MTLPATTYANSDYVEFDASFLQAMGGESIDISRFSRGNYVPPGDYIADVVLNNKFLGKVELVYVDDPANNTTKLCATPALLAILDLTSEAINSQALAGEICPSIAQVVPEAKFEFNMAELELRVGIAQAYVRQRPYGYISPARWQTGVPVLYARYNLNRYTSSNQGHKTDQYYLGVAAGLNVGRFSIRHFGSLVWSNRQSKQYSSSYTYLQHDIAPLRAQLRLGDFYTNSAITDNVSLRGVMLFSDDRMLASSERGYAPIIRGIANTNALVTVRQGGNILRQLTVPAGPFAITDLFPIAYNGNLEVEVQEANGQVQRFEVPYTATAELMRPGYSRYMLAAGRYREGTHVFNQDIVQASWQYGLTNDVTLNLGFNGAKGYHSEVIGTAINTPIGAFATNMTFSHALLDGVVFSDESSKFRGYSFSVSYNTVIKPTNTNVTVAAYRFLSKEYLALSDYINLINLRNVRIKPRHDIIGNYQAKHQLQLTVSQQLAQNYGYFYVRGIMNSYWANRAKQFNYQVGYSNNFKGVTYSVSLSQTRDSYGTKDSQLYVTFSVPLEFARSGNNRPYLTQTISQSSSNNFSSNTSLYGTLGDDGRYSYNVSYDHANNSKYNAINLSNSYVSPYATVNASFSKDNKDNRQFSYGISGAVVAHPRGVTLANDVSDTFAIVHAKGATGAKISGTLGNQIDIFGNGILPYLIPYALNTVGLRIDSIPDNVEFEATSTQVIPRANTAMLVEFDTTVGNTVFFDITNEGVAPPMGTLVFNGDGANIGVVTQGGRIYTRGVSNSGQLNLSWDNKTCKIDYKLSANIDPSLPVIVPVSCKF
ncbi:fimbria/pilus outer membrane usher protein [Psittacicella hinzii]|uniref:fimbria/pilus outer membrane usher protein n=1 Tax=Psittacicella hinzii TaxID=2028575 RepID=UPI00223AB466|nr:fimbria/pilus outer membrane usher protein [Psittacicella hinzii]